MTKRTRNAWPEEEIEEIVQAVCGRMREGQTVREAVAAMGVEATPGQVRHWMVRTEARQAAYAEAKRLLAQALAEEAIRVARESTNYSSAGDRLLIDTLKWAAAKANPAEYGERQTVEHQGAQTLKVEVVEEERELPARTTKAVRQALESAVLVQPVVGVLNAVSNAGALE